MREKLSARSLVLTVAVALVMSMVTLGAASAATVLVTNSNDDGAGSFRRAISAANGDPRVTRIQFLGNVSTIHLKQTIVDRAPRS